MKLKNIAVMPYDSAWPMQFQKEANMIKSVLADIVIEIHHIGSTSVPGLSAKKDLDIILVVDRLKNSLLLQKIGYIFKGELNIPLRYYFSKNTNESKVNLHVCEKTHGFISLNLAFRNWLRDNKDDKDSYQNLKYQILKSPTAGLKVRGMLSNYGREKDGFIKNIIRKSGHKETTVNFCMHDDEWESAKHFRNKYFFDPKNIQDPYTWTFENDKHKHFLLYKGVDVIGYAHIQLWPFQRAALRIIVIEEPYRNKNYGKELLHIVEQWLKLHGYQCLHTESSPTALNFYKKLGFEKMFFNDPDGYEGSPDDIEMGKLL